MPPYNHPVYILIITTIFFWPNRKSTESFCYVKDPLMWLPCYYGQDFMVQWRLYLWSSTVITVSNNNNNNRQMMNEKKK